MNGNQNASLSFDDVCKMASFSLALGCQISEAKKHVQLPTPDNGALEAKMAELARLYSEKPISVILKCFPVQPSSQSQHTCPHPCPLR